MDSSHGVMASALEVIEIAEVEKMLARGEAGDSLFSEAERSYARSKPDPARRLAARLAAKRAAARLLGSGTRLQDIEVVPNPGGPPRIRLKGDARARLRGAGAQRVLLSLTHGRTHAAASVLLLRDSPR